MSRLVWSPHTDTGHTSPHLAGSKVIGTNIDTKLIQFQLPPPPGQLTDSDEIQYFYHHLELACLANILWLWCCWTKYVILKKNMRVTLKSRDKLRLMKIGNDNHWLIRIKNQSPSIAINVYNVFHVFNVYNID